jgi:hypothetical protein
VNEQQQENIRQKHAVLSKFRFQHAHDLTVHRWRYGSTSSAG